MLDFIIHYSTFYPRSISEQEIITAIRADGFIPQKITNPPGYVYEVHQHPETKEIVCLAGSMIIYIGAKEFPFVPYDKIVIPGNTPHSAVVGPQGCTYLWSEK